MYLEDVLKKNVYIACMGGFLISRHMHMYEQKGILSRNTVPKTEKIPNPVKNFSHTFLLAPVAFQHAARSHEDGRRRTERLA